MATTSSEKRVAELRQKIEKANYEYHVLDQPTIADEAYDALMRELQSLRAECPRVRMCIGRRERTACSSIR